MPFGPQNRHERVAAIADADLDMLIVGGGINGVATARDAAMRGFKVACVEREDYAFGTSSRSSKLIHGGLRYLEQANFRLVFEGTHERATLREVAPHLVRPIPFLVPVYEGAKHGPLALGVGLWMYDTLAGKRRYGKHSRYAPDDLVAREPALRADGLRGGAIYYDCMTDDARLCVENAVSAHEEGAIMLNRTSFIAPERDEDGRVIGATIRDELTGISAQVKCRVLIHCAGPWTDEVLAACGDDNGMLRNSKGVHLLFDHARLPVQHAVVMSARADGRVVFAIPRGRVTLVGTTDTDYQDHPNNVRATREDVDYLLETVQHYFPQDPVGYDDVRATYAGLRPLVLDDSDSPYDVSREHTVVERDDGTVTIGGGKYTTYRRIADDVIKGAMKVMGLKRKDRPACPTREALLPGGMPLDELAAASQLADNGIADDMRQHLVHTYGSRYADVAAGDSTRIIAGLPYTFGEIDFAVNEESALAVEDVLVRRIPIFYEAPEQGLECVQAVADRMAGLLGWDAAKTSEQTAAYRHTVAVSQQWRSDPE
ncbi:MAG: glycerol-3-phosphate dehydrogenase [Myxococcota bacterium]|jgi:glycerol-3-phosphate dehydrogenase